MGKAILTTQATRDDFMRLAAEKTYRSREAYERFQASGEQSEIDLMVDLDYELGCIAMELDNLGEHDEAMIVQAWIAGESRWLPDREKARRDYCRTIHR